MARPRFDNKIDNKTKIYFQTSLYDYTTYFEDNSFTIFVFKINLLRKNKLLQ